MQQVTKKTTLLNESERKAWDERFAFESGSTIKDAHWVSWVYSFCGFPPH